MTTEGMNDQYMNSSKFPYIDMMVSHIFGNKYHTGILMLKQIILSPERFTPVMILQGPEANGKSLFCRMVWLLAGSKGSYAASISRKFFKQIQRSNVALYRSSFMELELNNRSPCEKEVFEWLNETIGLLELDLKEPGSPIVNIPNRMNFALTNVKNIRIFEGHTNYMILHVPPMSKQMTERIKGVDLCEKSLEERDALIEYLRGIQ